MKSGSARTSPEPAVEAALQVGNGLVPPGAASSAQIKTWKANATVAPSTPNRRWGREEAKGFKEELRTQKGDRATLEEVSPLEIKRGDSGSGQSALSSRLPSIIRL